MARDEHTLGVNVVYGGQSLYSPNYTFSNMYFLPHKKISNGPMPSYIRFYH